MTPTLPTEGFVRIPQILAVLPVSESSWFDGVRSGVYPQPVRHGRRSFWRVEDIRRLIDEIGNPEKV